MNAEFQWWLLILGIVIGGALVYLVLADLQGDRDENESDEFETRADEAESEVWSDGRVPSDEAGGEPGRTSAGDDRAVQRDGTQGETPVADLR